MPTIKFSVNSTPNAALSAPAPTSVKPNTTPVILTVSVTLVSSIAVVKSKLNSGLRPPRSSLTAASPVIANLICALSMVKLDRSTVVDKTLPKGVVSAAEDNDRPPVWAISPTNVPKSSAPATIG